MPVLEVSHLSHRYGERPALSDVSFSVEHGEVFGLLGPNGAGKTTTIRLINGLFNPSGGEIRVLEMDPVTQGEQIRSRTGVLTETPALYERLTARQNLEFFAAMMGVPAGQRHKRVTELLAQFELEHRADDRVGGFSKGMKQRLALARALLHNPQVVFLDEPTAGLDPEASLQVRDWIATITRQAGVTVVLCTHILPEAERLCDRVAVMGPGTLLAVGTLDQLRNQVMPGLWLHLELYEPCVLALSALRSLPGVLYVQPALDEEAGAGKVRSLRVQVTGVEVVPQVAAAVVTQGAPLLRLQPEQISLEEVYFKLQEGNGTR